MYIREDYPQAIRYFRQAIEQGHEVDSNTEHLAEALYRMGELVEARSFYRELYQRGYRSFALLTNLANLLVRAEEYAEARKLLEEAVEYPGIAPEARASS